MKSALVTGGAGFIGSHLVDRLLAEGWQVTVVDNFDPFYDPEIKRKNIAPHFDYGSYKLVEVDIRDLGALREQLTGEYDVIVHLAAKAGVRPSIRDPIGYQDVNVRGTQNLLELAKEWGVKQFVFASSSSVYGVNPHVPWREDDCVLMPISPYAATKVAGELLGHVYSHLYGIRFIALRFFTVYGPRQRPDLAIHKFARLMLKREPIPVYGDGTSRRDYTYIDDIIQGVRAAMDYTKTQYEVINLGNNRTVSLMELIRALEEVLGVEAKLEYLPPQPGDVPLTLADMDKAGKLLCYTPVTNLFKGLFEFKKWITNVN
ncbi:UDP-glucuronate 5'-epimerase [Thermacetogenium phaeum DSM 12270]|uniref:UDP-glucuronate 5'-epimerase n=1 Tax=Thermacetogenium phaeum (strain ATCC BAA-254 / DSM 26808 / PB) TaxID=1089553 RepID=K4LEK1_THEPS|nr:NAD-dependent epimerase/dehydratase family protein [Thermacetogenium phaeum]AFV10517.1 UDP-glucuronate 5'-epimerase [Thermacetogenium phaeum DSM 12270]